ncbi:MAG: response regulator transcription factor [Eubacteriales bacterium]|nr:response regulator transcription factor [Eubacteriales bacterium]
MRILFAEDDRSLNRAVTVILKKQNYDVDSVYTGEDAYDYLKLGDYDGAILDVMMPGLDGFEVLRRLRSEGFQLPILILSAKSEVEDRVFGLDNGADDYLCKPFAIPELLARLRAMLRPSTAADSCNLDFADLRLNCENFQLHGPNAMTDLPRKEFQILEALMRARGQILPSEGLPERLWGYESEATPNLIQVYISSLRKKFKEIGSHVEIRSKRHSGYYLHLLDDQNPAGNDSERVKSSDD